MPRQIFSANQLREAEADESGFWLEFMVRIELASDAAVRGLRAESSELVAIFTASKKTVTERIEKKKYNPHLKRHTLHKEIK